MTAGCLTGPTREGRWRNPAIVAASLGLHAVVVGYMAFDEIRERRRYGPDTPLEESFGIPVVYLDLRPRSAPEAAKPLDGTLPTAPRTEADRPAAPSLPSPRFTTEAQAGTAPAQPPAAGGAVVWARPETPGDRIGQGLRESTLGCANAQFLSLIERDACDQRFGERAELAVPSRRTRPSSSEDGFARQAAANDAWRAYKEGDGAYPGLRSFFTER